LISKGKWWIMAEIGIFTTDDDDDDDDDAYPSLMTDPMGSCFLPSFLH